MSTNEKRNLQFIDEFLTISNYLLQNPQHQQKPQEIAEATGLSITTVRNYFRKNNGLSRDSNGDLLNFSAVTKLDVIDRVLRYDINILLKSQDQILEALDNNELSISQLVQVSKLAGDRYLAFSQHQSSEDRTPIANLKPETIVALANFIKDSGL